MLKHPPLQLLGQLGQVLSVLLRSHDDAFLGRRSGNLVDFLGDFVLGSVQLRSQTLVLLQEEQEEQEMPFRTSAHGPGMVIIGWGMRSLVRITHAIVVLQRSCAASARLKRGGGGSSATVWLSVSRFSKSCVFFSSSLAMSIWPFTVSRSSFSSWARFCREHALPSHQLYFPVSMCGMFQTCRSPSACPFSPFCTLALFTRSLASFKA